MKVYRVQHKTRTVGPLCSGGTDMHGASWSYFARDHDDPEDVDPDLYAKRFPKGVGIKHRFGMQSYAMLDDLFYKHARVVLQNEGFRAIELEVPDEHCAVFSDGQVIFDRTKVESLTVLKGFMPEV